MLPLKKKKITRRFVGLETGREREKKFSSLSRMLIKPLLNGMTHLFTCYFYVGMSVHGVALESECLCF